MTFFKNLRQNLLLATCLIPHTRPLPLHALSRLRVDRSTVPAYPILPTTNNVKLLLCISISYKLIQFTLLIDSYTQKGGQAMGKILQKKPFLESFFKNKHKRLEQVACGLYTALIYGLHMCFLLIGCFLLRLLLFVLGPSLRDSLNNGCFFLLTYGGVVCLAYLLDAFLNPLLLTYLERSIKKGY